MGSVTKNKAACDLEKYSFSGGTGQADFKMKQGSFKIRDHVTEKFAFQVRKESTGRYILENGERHVVITADLSDSEAGTCIRFRQTAGETINRFWIEMPAAPGEHIYGCGETFSEFDLKGKEVRIWVAEHQNFARMVRKVVKNTFPGTKRGKKLSFHKYESYYAQPTFMSSGKYYTHVDSDAYMKFGFGENKTVLYIHALPGKMWVGQDESFSGLSKKLSLVLGKQPPVPEWINDGLIIAVQGDTAAIEKKLDTAEKYGIPVAGVWTQDWCGARFTAFGRQVMWDWSWDRELYPGLDKLIERLHQKGIHFLGYINPFIAIEGAQYKEAKSKGYCIKNSAGEDYMATTTTFPAAMIDFTNQEAYDWYKEIIKQNMIGLGLDGWMADFGEYMPVDAVLCNSDHNEETHNRWPALWAQMNHEAVTESGRAGDIFYFTRAGHTRTVRHSMMMWNGDQHVDWSIDDGIPSVIPATLSLAMSGFGCTHSYIGGYTTMPKCVRSRELLMRWMELAVFSPVMRCHEGNRPSDNIQFDKDGEVLLHTAKMVRLHLFLKDYIRDCIRANTEESLPVMRPLFYHYEEEEAYREAYSYLLGRELLCSPVQECGQRKKQVYLPADEWIHLFTGESFGGGHAEVDCPISMPPVFYRKNGKYTELFEKVKELMK